MKHKKNGITNHVPGLTLFIKEEKNAQRKAKAKESLAHIAYSRLVTSENENTRNKINATKKLITNFFNAFFFDTSFSFIFNLDIGNYQSPFYLEIHKYWGSPYDYKHLAFYE